MTASDYQISFPYGATSTPYSPAHPHRGDDRPCPTGTPVVLAGTQIGLTGATGFVSGPHLHIQEWNGNVANTRKPQNSFKPGTVVQAATSSDFGNYVTIQCADGWNDSYCHLSRIDVKVGQVIGDIMVNKGDIVNMAALAGWKPPQNYIDFWNGKSWHDFMYDLYSQQEFLDNLAKEYGSDGFKELNQVVYVKE